LSFTENLLSNVVSINPAQALLFMNTMTNLQQSDSSGSKSSTGSYENSQKINKNINNIADAFINSKKVGEKESVISSSQMSIAVGIDEKKKMLSKNITTPNADLALPNSFGDNSNLENATNVAIKLISNKNAVALSNISDISKNISSFTINFSMESTNGSLIHATNLTAPIKFTIPFITSQNISNLNLNRSQAGVRPVCKFWDSRNMTWSSYGCYFDQIAETYVVCACKQISNPFKRRTVVKKRKIIQKKFNEDPVNPVDPVLPPTEEEIIDAEEKIITETPLTFASFIEYAMPDLNWLTWEDVINITKLNADNVLTLIVCLILLIIYFGIFTFLNIKDLIFWSRDIMRIHKIDLFSTKKKLEKNIEEEIKKEINKDENEKKEGIKINEKIDNFIEENQKNDNIKNQEKKENLNKQEINEKNNIELNIINEKNETKTQQTSSNNKKKEVENEIIENKDEKENGEEKKENGEKKQEDGKEKKKEDGEKKQEKKGVEDEKKEVGNEKNGEKKEVKEEEEEEKEDEEEGKHPFRDLFDEFHENHEWLSFLWIPAENEFYSRQMRITCLFLLIISILASGALSFGKEPKNEVQFVLTGFISSLVTKPFSIIMIFLFCKVSPSWGKSNYYCARKKKVDEYFESGQNQWWLVDNLKKSLGWLFQPLETLFDVLDIILLVTKTQLLKIAAVMTWQGLILLSIITLCFIFFYKIFLNLIL
jgi:hypothetical protein